MRQRDMPSILLGLVILIAVLSGPSVTHRLLVPALGLVVGIRVWWPPASGSGPAPIPPGPAPDQSAGAGSTTPKIPATLAKLRHRALR
jgi:hypothetical protein